jgi:hypothetical protein
MIYKGTKHIIKQIVLFIVMCFAGFSFFYVYRNYNNKTFDFDLTMSTDDIYYIHTYKNYFLKTYENLYVSQGKSLLVFTEYDKMFGFCNVSLCRSNIPVEFLHKLIGYPQFGSIKRVIEYKFDNGSTKLLNSTICNSICKNVMNPAKTVSKILFCNRSILVF